MVFVVTFLIKERRAASTPTSFFSTQHFEVRMGEMYITVHVRVTLFYKSCVTTFTIVNKLASFVRFLLIGSISDH